VQQHNLAVVVSDPDDEPLDDDRSLPEPDDSDLYWFIDAFAVRSFSPEERLRIAMLGDAIYCLQKKTSKANTPSINRMIRREREAAKSWLDGGLEAGERWLPSCSFSDVFNIVLGHRESLTENDFRQAIYRLLKERRFDIRELIFWLQS
jgi:hypothetical protein